MKSLLFILFFAAMAVNAAAQSSLAGKLSTRSGTALPDVLVQLFRLPENKLHKTVSSDSRGRFAFASLEPGQYSLNISLVGFKQRSIPLGIDSSSAVSLDSLILDTATSVLQEVTVLAHRSPIEQRIDRTVINVDDAVRKENDNALDIIRLAPGISVEGNDDKVSMPGKESVQILVNNKPSRMSDRDLLNFLKSISSEMVAQVEVISNPSARYSVDGRKGILNVKLKRDYESGVNGNASAEWTRGVNSQSDVTTSLNYGGRNIVIYGYGGYNWGAYQQKNSGPRTTNDNGAGYRFNSQFASTDHWRDPDFRVGADYTIDKRNVLGVLLELEKSNNHTDYTNIDEIHKIPAGGPPVDSLITTRSYSPYHNTWTTGNLNYQYTGSNNFTLNVDLDNSFYRNKRNNTVTDLFASSGPESPTSNANNYFIDTRIDINTQKLDITRKFDQVLDLETGIKASQVNISTGFISIPGTAATAFADSSLSNTYTYKEYVEAAYLNLSKTIGKFGFQAGLRAEHTSVNGQAVTLLHQLTHRPDSNYLTLLPSAFVTYNPSENDNFRLSFSKNLRRPNYGAFQPFVYELDAYSYYLGNPFLNPQSTFNYELSYVHADKYTFTLSYTDVHNQITPLLYQQGVFLNDGTFNAGNSRNLNLEVNLPVTITEWWTAKNRLSVAYDDYAGLTPQGYFTGNKYSWSLTTIQRLSLPGKLIMQLTGAYHSPGIMWYYQTGSWGTFDGYIGRRLMHDRAILKIGGTDFLFTQKKHNTIDFNGLSYQWLQQQETRNFYIQLSYRFGNSRIRSAREREMGNANEKERTGK
ncbi:MAG TPA: TonB-dependent receptor [Puia sp.]|uniref:TonB-dependent receptor domain-containing protein n=1 Tax=Puia sp. TaxID=2045100 RepID=UPI002C43C3BD|nr:TonB-dependent receptor [Puia sp.]HVU94512.1 TonB-dependent receptor [Puia sp.]